jgi:parallel beta-helix repeat protein
MKTGNLASANGLFFPCPGCFDFGIGVFGRGNLIEGNRVTGNTPDGIEVYPGATGNTVRGNVAFGNSPIQSTVTNPHFGFADIDDQNVTLVNNYVDNLCETGGFSASFACPNTRQQREDDDAEND